MLDRNGINFPVLKEPEDHSKMGIANPRFGSVQIAMPLEDITVDERLISEKVLMFPPFKNY
jgi:hypothetical protein